MVVMVECQDDLRLLPVNVYKRPGAMVRRILLGAAKLGLNKELEYTCIGTNDSAGNLSISESEQLGASAQKKAPRRKDPIIMNM